MERLTALQELAGDEGSLEKSALALSDEQAYAVARDVAHWSNLLEQRSVRPRGGKPEAGGGSAVCGRSRCG